MNTLIQTYSGRLVNPFDLQESDILIDDIAHSLAHICRFNGHCVRFYSVAQHSVHVAERVHALGGPTKVVLAALLHDASEAYLGDIGAPLKHHSMFDTYRGVEHKVQRTIYRRFGLGNGTTSDARIQRADRELLWCEAENLMGGGTDWESPAEEYRHYKKALTPLLPDAAVHFFKRFFHEVQE